MRNDESRRGVRTCVDAAFAPQGAPLRHVTAGGHRLEFQLIAAPSSAAPTIVFLHEGLGSISLWKDFPRRLAAACGCGALVYSRYGNGASAALGEPRPVEYMHREGLDVLPELLERLSIATPILFGHSDGASIAIIYAAFQPRAPRAMILCAPHVFVEDVTIHGIRAAKVAYETTSFRTRLARHHADVDGTFRGWNDIWLDPAFRAWNIESCLPKIICPILAVQGYDDEYGTMEQIDRIAEQTSDVSLLKLHECAHSPHRDQPEAVIQATMRFLDRMTT